MVPGDHGTTYGGNPFVCGAAEKVLDIFESRELTAHVEKVGRYLWKELEAVKAKYDIVKDHRGMGLMQGLEFAVPVGPIVTNALLEQKLVLISAGTNVIRFVPPLVIREEDVDAMIGKLAAAIESVGR